MRILLVNPVHPGIRPEDEQESLGLGYLAAVARREGHEVEILDAAPYRWPPARLARAVAERTAPGGVDLVGVSVMFQELIPAAMSLVADLRRAGYRGHVAIGGHPPTFLHRELRRDYRGFDSLAVGEAEETFAELLRALAAGRDWTGLPGLVAADGGVAVPRPLVANLDDLPFPARDTLPTYMTRGQGPRTASVLRSRGCYGDCSFCDTRAFYAASPGAAWRVRSAVSVAEEIAALARDHGVEAIRFWDDNFMGPGKKGREAAEDLARELIKRQAGGACIRFSFECRVTDVDADLFGLLKEAGLRRVFLGVESANQRQLDYFNKKVTVADNLRALSVLQELGIEVTVGMIIFDPDTTVKELNVNLEFLRTAFGGLAGSRDQVARPWNRLEVYAGTPLEKTLRGQGRLKGNYVRYDYDFSDPTVGRIYRSGTALRRLGLPIRDALNRLHRRS